MTYTAILPNISDDATTNMDIVNLTCVFNRWLKMLNRYGKLDSYSMNDDFATIAKVIKAVNTKRSIRNIVATCRDYALAGASSIDRLVMSIYSALEVLCESQEYVPIRNLKQQYAEQGMSKRYKSLSKRLAREKIHKIGKEIAFTDSGTDEPKTTKLVRRIVEKRAAQAVFRNSKNGERDSNLFRQNVRRATSFSLYNLTFADYDQKKRAKGTHWKVVFGKFGKKLKSKNSYNSYDDAIAACNSYMLNHPYDIRVMNAYKCEHCGKWHIGHERVCRDNQMEMQSAC